MRSFGGAGRVVGANRHQLRLADCERPGDDHACDDGKDGPPQDDLLEHSHGLILRQPVRSGQWPGMTKLPAEL
jgi:hypothetical protein